MAPLLIGSPIWQLFKKMDEAAAKNTLGVQIALGALAVVVGSVAVALAAVVFDPNQSAETKAALQQATFALGILLATFALSIVITASIGVSKFG